MKTSRQEHFRHMRRTLPWIVLLYGMQLYLYQKFTPVSMHDEIYLFLSLALSLIILGHFYFALHHQIVFYQNHLEVSFKLFKFKREIFYKAIKQIEVQMHGSHFGSLTIFTGDGHKICLYHIDSPHKVRLYLEMKKSELSS